MFWKTLGPVCYPEPFGLLANSRGEGVGREHASFGALTKTGSALRKKIFKKRRRNRDHWVKTAEKFSF